MPLLAACGGNDQTTASDPAHTPAAPPATGSSSPTATGGAATGGAGEAGLVAASDVPVGGGVVLKDQELVVTQPAAGEFKCFKALCTHQGCLVGSVTDGKIVCPCHGSSFSITDGAVEGGPAPSALPAVQVKVSGGQVDLA
ncbi:hypothetical protein GCM10022237_16670 [Nocardioides ginsengisoli]